MRLIYTSAAFKWRLWSTKVQTFGPFGRCLLSIEEIGANNSTEECGLVQIISFQLGNSTHGHQPHKKSHYIRFYDQTSTILGR